LTSLVCWVGHDHRKVNSIYVASDSRITRGEAVISDNAQKVFAYKARPEIFGYCGNAERPPLVISDLVVRLDKGAVVARGLDAFLAAERVRSFLEQELPMSAGGVDYRATEIVWGTRVGEGYANAAFHAFLFFVRDDRWDWRRLDLPDRSDVVHAAGSGAAAVRAWRSYWTSAQRNVRTSRAVFSALCNVLHTNADARSGGAPQLVGMYQEDLPAVFGVLFNAERFALGKRVPADEAALWHDDLFQICDGETLQPRRGAARHHRPRGL
jgi:hypothetical protein